MDLGEGIDQISFFFFFFFNVRLFNKYQFKRQGYNTHTQTKRQGEGLFFLDANFVNINFANNCHVMSQSLRLLFYYQDSQTAKVKFQFSSLSSI